MLAGSAGALTWPGVGSDPVLLCPQSSGRWSWRKAATVERRDRTRPLPAEMTSTCTTARSAPAQVGTEARWPRLFIRLDSSVAAAADLAQVASNERTRPDSRVCVGSDEGRSCPPGFVAPGPGREGGVKGDQQPRLEAAGVHPSCRQRAKRKF